MLALAIALALACPSGHLADIGPAPAVELTDASGRPFRLADLRGKAVLVSFIFTNCSGVCPATTAELDRCRRVLRDKGLWGKRVVYVSITLDPERDTPEALARYAANYRAEPPSWTFLTGSPADVRKVHDAWGMRPRLSSAGVIDHPSRVFLIDPRGRQREIYNLEFLKPETVAKDVISVLDESDASPKSR